MNCVKHADANCFKTQITFKKNSVLFQFSDDGKGFVESKVKLGNGLKNIKMRSDLIDANFQLNSNPTITVIQIIVPL